MEGATIMQHAWCIACARPGQTPYLPPDARPTREVPPLVEDVVIELEVGDHEAIAATLRKIATAFAASPRVWITVSTHPPDASGSVDRMENTQPVSVGRIVHFHPGVDMPPEAALVIAVHTQQTLTLQVCNDQGTWSTKRSVSYGNADAAKLEGKVIEGAFWTWPPRV